MQNMIWRAYFKYKDLEATRPCKALRTATRPVRVQCSELRGEIKKMKVKQAGARGACSYCETFRFLSIIGNHWSFKQRSDVFSFLFRTNAYIAIWTTHYNKSKTKWADHLGGYSSVAGKGQLSLELQTYQWRQ